MFNATKNQQATSIGNSRMHRKKLNQFNFTSLSIRIFIVSNGVNYRDSSSIISLKSLQDKQSEYYHGFNGFMLCFMKEETLMHTA